jgi:catalase
VDSGVALTPQQGVVVADDQNTSRVGDHLPTAGQDLHFREKLFHFDHERIPERVVHARGYGAHSHFENYESLPYVTPRRATGTWSGTTSRSSFIQDAIKFPDLVHSLKPEPGHVRSASSRASASTRFAS